MLARSLDRRRRERSTENVGVNTRLAALRQYVNFALAYSVAFQPEMDYFGDEKGFLAYKKVGSTALVLSNPVAPIGECANLIRRFMREMSDICVWQASRPVAEVLGSLGFSVNGMGMETRIELAGYNFDGPGKRNFRRALRHAADRGYVTAERSASSLERQELKAVSEQWRQTRRVKNREMTFLTRPAVLEDEIDVRKFFAFDREGRLQAFAFFDPIYEVGEVVGYLCSAKRRLPEADTLVGYAILHCAIQVFMKEGIKLLSLGLSPFCGIQDKELASDHLVGFWFRQVYRNRLFNRFIYPLRGFASHKGAFGGSVEQTYYAFNRHPSLPRLLKMVKASNLV